MKHLAVLPAFVFAFQGMTAACGDGGDTDGARDDGTDTDAASDADSDSDTETDADSDTGTEESIVEATPVFEATFESGNLTPDVGGSELINENNGGTISVVDNPYLQGANTSSKVMMPTIPPGSSVRAEYHNGTRLEMDEKSYIFIWKELFPTDYLAGADVSWLVYAQWKTWPCGEYDNPSVAPYDTADYATHICGGGGIFNDIEMDAGDLYSYDIRFRAEPDCNNLLLSNDQGVWHTFIEEIYWTNTSNGYYRIYKNGQLLLSVDNVKTLFDEFPADLGICDLYWGLGLYATWADAGQSAMSVYIDDMRIYDKDDGVEVSHICPECVE
jgi:hypothetical protein